MNRITIADAAIALEELLGSLTNAYWDTSEIHRKDCVFDMITTLFGELNELSKLSVEDQMMTYEPVTTAFHSINVNLRQLQNNIENWYPRTSTSRRLQSTIPPVSRLLEIN